MEVLHVDLTGPHVSSQGYRYILTACDSFTRFVVALPLRNKTAVSAAQALVREVFLKLGTPFQILTDLGGEFQNELWKEMCKLLGITRLRTTAYCHLTNGKVERWHRSLHDMMADGGGRFRYITVSEIFNVKCNATVDVTLIRPLNRGQGHSFWYQSISNIRLPIGSQ